MLHRCIFNFREFLGRYYFLQRLLDIGFQSAVRTYQGSKVCYRISTRKGTWLVFLDRNIAEYGVIGNYLHLELVDQINSVVMVPPRVDIDDEVSITISVHDPAARRPITFWVSAKAAHSIISDVIRYDVDM